MNKTFSLLLLVFSICFTKAQETQKQLEQQIKQRIAGKNATVGISLQGIDTNFSLGINSEKKLALLSVFKLHLALATLDLVDQKKLSLSQKIKVTPSELLPNTWSPFREQYPEGKEASLLELIEYSVAKSDNNTTDILLQLIGGTKQLNRYLRSHGIREIHIACNEQQMHQSDSNIYKNWATPRSLSRTLKLLSKNKLLSKESTNSLLSILENTTTGANKLKAGLPLEAKLGHKTGSSGTNKKGITIAENDIGIFQTPSGKKYAIAILVNDSTQEPEINCSLIAEITKLCYDYLCKYENEQP